MDGEGTALTFIPKRPCVERTKFGTSRSNITVLTRANEGVNTRLFNLKDGSSVRISRSVLEEIPWKQSFEHLTEEDPQAVRVFMTILHHKHALLPLSMCTEQLYELAMVCDKYDVTSIVFPHVESRGWISALWKDDKPCDKKWLLWLSILHIFHIPTKRCQRLKKVMDVLAANMAHQSLREGWIVSGGDNLWRVSCIESSSKIESLHGKHFIRTLKGRTNHFQDTLRKRREKLLSSFRTLCHNEKKVLLDDMDPDFYTIGVISSFMMKIGKNIPPEMSLVAKLRGLKESARFWDIPEHMDWLIDAELRKYEI